MPAPTLTTLDQVAEAARRSSRRSFWVEAVVLPDVRPVQTPELGLPFPVEMGGPVPVIVRADVEHDYARQPLLSRPDLERWERGRNFVVGDGTGRALVRAGNKAVGHGPLDEDLSLHLDVPFEEQPLGVRRLFLRGIRAGDRIWLHTPAYLAPGSDEDIVTLGGEGYRGSPDTLVLGTRPDAPTAWAIYDQPAFVQHATWAALPWLRKLSILVRNR